MNLGRKHRGAFLNPDICPCMRDVRENWGSDVVAKRLTHLLVVQAKTRKIARNGSNSNHTIDRRKASDIPANKHQCKKKKLKLNLLLTEVE